MSILLDSGILLRLANSQDQLHTPVLHARHFQGFAAEGIRVRTIDEFPATS